MDSRTASHLTFIANKYNKPKDAILTIIGDCGYSLHDENLVKIVEQLKNGQDPLGLFAAKPEEKFKVQIGKTFVYEYFSGKATLENIDDFIDFWHEHFGSKTDRTPDEHLYEYLGFTEEEYMTWVQSPSLLGYLLVQKKSAVINQWRKQ